MKINVKSAVKILKSRLSEVTKIRDKLRADQEEFYMLLDSCERAKDELEAAICALSERA